jgi:pimeloyl-ACP methyl ester carboxylesterase
MVPTAVRLAPRFQVFAPDLPGFGRSPGPPEVLSVAGLADALAHWLDANRIERAAFVGNSFGCQIIAELALRYPERVDRLVLLGPTIDSRARTVHQQALRLLQDIRREPPIAPWNYLRDLWTANIRRGFGTLWHALTDRVEDRLPYIHVPTLVVRGEIDPIAPQAWAEELTARLPCGHLVVVPGGTHTINASAPDGFVWAIEPFLAETPGRHAVAAAPERHARSA